jgi:hypothetical protein
MNGIVEGIKLNRDLQIIIVSREYYWQYFIEL